MILASKVYVYKPLYIHYTQFVIALFLFFIVNLPNETCAFKRSTSKQQQQQQHQNHVQLNESSQATQDVGFLSLTRPPANLTLARKPIANQTSSKDQQLTKRHNVEPDDYRVPFWNIAHMINSIEQVEPALREGANGIETDISFNEAGFPIEAYHGFPCDCGRFCHERENLIKFIKHIAQITSPPYSSSLHVLVLDLKLKDLNAEQKETGGRYLAAILDEHLYRTYLQARKRYGEMVEPPVRVVISINHAVDHVLVRGFLSFVREHQLDFLTRMVGFDVGMNDDLDMIQAMWNGFNGATMNIWQGDGLTNCANIIRGVDRLKSAISIRNGQGHFRKIYYWTADVMYHIRTVLRLGLDAIMTNQPDRVVKVLNEREFVQHYRLASAYDDPFAQFSIKPTAWQVSPPSLDEAIETLSNIQKTSAKFVKDLPVAISTAIDKLTRPSHL